MINIKSIKELYDRDAPAMHTGQLLSQALELFETSKSSAIIIIDDRKHPVGILTERDIIRQAGHWDESISLSVTEVMTSPVTTIDQDHDFRDAYMQMSENGFRHLVVVQQDGSLAGLLDEGDFLRHLTPEQLLAVKEVKLVMSKDVTTVKSTQSVAEAIKLMTQSKISSIIVIQEKKPLGIITERDSIHFVRQGDALLQAPISEYMTSPLKTIHENNSVIDAEYILTHQHIRHLVVVNDQGELSGIVSQHDLVKGISGIYIEMLRDTIHKQSKRLIESYNQLEEQSVLNNILNSFADKLIIACNLNSVIEFTNADIFQCVQRVPQKGKKLDKSITFFESSICDSILHGEVTKVIYSEAIISDPQGKKHYFKTSYTPIFSPKKLLQGFLFTAEDVTSEEQSFMKQKETTEKLKETKELLEKQNLLLQEREEQLLQYKHIVSATTDLIVFIDKAYRFIAVNDAYLHYHKKTREEVLNSQVIDLIGHDNFYGIKADLDRAFKGNEFTLQLHDFITIDGDKRYGEVRFYPYKNGSEETEAIVLNIRDITEKQIALQNEKKLLDLVDSSSNEIYVFNKENLRLSYANHGALSNLQYTLQELQTMHAYDIKPQFSKEGFVDYIQPLLQKELSKLVFETEHKRKDNSTYPVEVNLQLLKTQDDNEEFLAIITDITQRKRIERQLKLQDEMMIIQSRQAAMGEMISMIAHQWRQPLSIVTMIINNLLLDIKTNMFDTDVAQKDFGEINNQLQYMSSTIEDFRNFFKPSKEIERDYVLNILQDIINIIAPSLNANTIELQIECDSMLMLETYKSEFKQVMINILSNAKDALSDSPIENKMIKISVAAKDEYIIFSIFNNGPKIDFELLHRIFEPYFTTKEILGGTGIGLYMSQSIVEKHMHGKVEVNNRDKGVEFTITVPKILKGNADE